MQDLGKGSLNSPPMNSGFNVSFFCKFLQLNNEDVVDRFIIKRLYHVIRYVTFHIFHKLCVYDNVIF